jgi:hypothetical protein
MNNAGHNTRGETATVTVGVSVTFSEILLKICKSRLEIYFFIPLKLRPAHGVKTFNKLRVTAHIVCVTAVTAHIVCLTIKNVCTVHVQYTEGFK